MQEYQNRSVIGDAVQFESDQIPNLTYNQVLDAMARIDSVDAQTNVKSQEALADENFVKRLLNYNPSLAYRLYEGIRSLTKSSSQASQIEYNFLKAFRDVDPNTLRNRVYGLFTPQTNNETGMQYAIDLKGALQKLSSIAYNASGKLKSIKEQVSDYFSGKFKRYDLLVARENSNGLGDYGLDESRPMTMRQSVIDKIFSLPTGTKHGHGDSINGDIADYVVNHPENIVFAVKNDWGNYAFIYDVPGLDGNPVLMSINENRKPGAVLEINDISNMYGKRNLQDYIDDCESRGFDIILNEKSDDFALVEGVRFPLSSVKITTSNNNISNNDQNVKNSLDLNNEDLRNPDLLAVHNISADKLRKEPIYYTGSGKIGFVADPSDPINYATALLFGKWATDEGKEYIENDFKPASQTETKLFDNLNEGNATEAFNIEEETFEAKKEYSTREEFLGYLDSAPYNNKDKNEILDTYYGENKIVSNLNDFADQYGLDEDEMYQIKSYGLNQKGVLDSNGRNISNTKALNYRKQLTEMGLYDSLVKYIEKSGVAPADVGLTKTVYGMSDAEFESKYNYYFNSDGTAKTGTQSSGSSRSSRRSGSRSRKVKDAYGVSEDDYNKAIQSIDNIYNKIQSKIYSNANSFFDIEIPDIKELKIDISNELKLDTNIKDLFKKYSSSMFDDLIDSYLEDHPYSNLFEGL